jgi:hypothetical protein
VRTAIPQAITFIVASVLIVAVFVPPLEPVREEFGNFFNILAAFAFVLGAVSLLGRHHRRIQRRAGGWGYSVVCIASFAITLVVGLFKIGSPAGIGGSAIAEGSPFAWIFEYVFTPIDATLFSLLAFYVASAAFRAFRVRNVEATVMLVTAILLLLGRTFLGSMLTAWLPVSLKAFELPNLVQWIMYVPLTAGSRAIMIGVALGIIATSLKIILGIDRPYLGGGK